MYTQSVASLVSKNVGNSLANYKTWNSIIYNVLEYSAKGDGVTDDTGAIQSTIDAVNIAGGGVVFFPTGTYLISSPLTIYSKVYLVGSNYNTTEITAKSGFSGSAMVKSDGFDTLTGNNKWFTSDGVVHGFKIAEIQLDGNFQSVIGCQFYAKRYFIENVMIRDCNSGGFYSEAGNVAGQTDWTDMPEGKIEHLWLRDNLGVSFEFNGNHDMVIGFIAARNRDGVTTGTTGVKIGYDTTINGMCDINMIHAYGHEYGMIINGKVKANLLIAESCYNEAIQIVGSSCLISKIELYNNNRANSGVYDLVLDGDANNIGLCELVFNPETTNQKGVFLTTSKSLIKLNLYGSGIGAEGIRIEGQQNQVSGVIDNIPSGVAVQTGSGTGGWIGNIIDVDVQNCGTAWNNGSAGYGNRYNIKYYGGSGTLFSGIRPNRGGVEEVCAIGRIGSTTILSEQWIQSIDAIDLTITSQQTINVNHSLIAQPFIEHVHGWLIKSTNVNDFAIDYIRVNSTNTTQIAFDVKLGTASGTAGAKATLGVHAKF